MKIDVRYAEGIPILAPRGRVTIGSTSIALKTALDSVLDAGAAHVILDGSHVEYLDSTGIGELIAAARRLAESGGGRVGIARPSDKLREILDITGLSALFVVADSEEQIAGALANAAPIAF